MAKPKAKKRTRLAAIDLGSNGVRIQIGMIRSSGELKIIMAHRVALRLGADAFSTGRLSEETIETAVETFRMFRRRLDTHDVDYVRAVATSAARNAINGPDLADRILQAAGIRLDIINGLEEAQLVFAAISDQIDLARRSALLVDMGGGSVEMTVAEDGRARGCDTFPLGPVRLKQRLADAGMREDELPLLLERDGVSVEELVEAKLGRNPPDICLGTGGNIECMARLRASLLGKAKKGRVTLADLESLVPTLLGMSVEERIEQLQMRPDRADVIAIAAQVLHFVADDARVTRIVVPGVGLKDGVMRQLAQLVSSRSTSHREAERDRHRLMALP